ncbi:MAG: hypothetical protein HF962_00540 [Sulfurovum sp.]|nr:hypothetical protein [Sulfurovum sp.]
MAYNTDDKMRIRAFYETHDLSARATAQHFQEIGYSVSEKTVQGWARKEEWVKQRFDSLETAVAALLPEDLLSRVGDTVKQQIIEQATDAIEGRTEPLPTEIIGDYAEKVSRELIWQNLSREALLGKMANNLRKADKIAEGSSSMGVVATYHGMLTSAIQTVHGKQISIISPNKNSLSQEELDSLSTEELMARLER